MVFRSDRKTIRAERQRRRGGPPVAMLLESTAVLNLPGDFRLRGRADRLEKRADGSVLVMDYKTGTPPAAKQVEIGSKPQLPLEAVMVEAGAFGAALQGEVTELAYWKLTGRHDAGDDKTLFKDKAALRGVIDQARESLLPLLENFANAATPYLAQPHPGRATYADVYAGISRSGEWRAESEAEDG